MPSELRLNSGNRSRKSTIPTLRVESGPPCYSGFTLRRAYGQAFKSCALTDGSNDLNIWIRKWRFSVRRSICKRMAIYQANLVSAHPCNQFDPGSTPHPAAPEVSMTGFGDAL